jgi:phage shock protein PspC (stress-responsive transcriptional regulator)
MNKTVNINLAGIFFHIDEDAYLKLQRYLEAIKRSFTDSQGRNEIIADIEARIAELFNERVEDEKQVIGTKEVDEVITIMGQPEDYMVDEEIFEDEPKKRSTSSSSRKLYRDTENAYIGGVSAGLSHYFDIDPLWIRIAWVVLFFGFGTGILVYILLWILMPAAESTSEKLAMSGKPVNITNIEEKVKEGFGNVKESIDEVADRVSNADYGKAGNKVRNTSRSFFDALGNVILFFFKIVAKFIGIILMIVGASTLIGLIVGLLSAGVADILHFPGVDFADAVNSTSLPIWLVSILVLFAVGIPFFYIFILGLKILVNNLRSLGRVAHFTLLALWLASIVTLAIFAAKEVAEYSREGNFTETIELNVKANDTLKVKMVNNDLYSRSDFRGNDFDIVFDENDQKNIYSSNVRFILRSTSDSIATLRIEKNARGRSYQNARERASAIEYNHSLDNGELLLDNYFLTDFENKFRDQDVRITLYMPEGSIIYAEENTKYQRRWRYTYDLLKHGMEGHYLRVSDDDVICLDCNDSDNSQESPMTPESDSETSTNSASSDSDEVEVKIDSSGIDVDPDN